ncbi:hypothetical protein CHS0354_034460, partial [Potamilus streckersoni]
EEDITRPLDKIIADQKKAADDITIVTDTVNRVEARLTNLSTDVNPKIGDIDKIKITRLAEKVKQIVYVIRSGEFDWIKDQGDGNNLSDPFNIVGGASPIEGSTLRSLNYVGGLIP